ncbi:MAG: amino acid racemase, partial [Pseudomonadota bacterium]
ISAELGTTYPEQGGIYAWVRDAFASRRRFAHARTMSEQKIVGVLGGMGPEATIDFMARIVAHTEASSDQDHLHMIVDQNPGVPSRQDALLSAGADPGPVMATMAKRLEAAGADFLVMPCNTAHAWQQQVRDAVDIPLLSIVDATVNACDGYSPIGLLATDGCLAAAVYDADSALLPDENEQTRVMEIVNAIKRGDRSPELKRDMLKIATDLVDRGAQAIVAACTEIPLVLANGDLSVPVIESTEELALATVRFAQEP